MDRNLTLDEYIPLDDAKNLIVAALSQYHPELADRAAIFLKEKAIQSLIILR